MNDSLTHTRREPLFFITGGIILCLSIIARYLSYPVITSDYQYFVSKWFTTLATAPGLSAFKNVFANYAPLYLYFIKALIFLPFPALFSAKMLSTLFDIIIALLICALLRYLDAVTFSFGRLFLTFAIFITIPTVLLNSALWAQCDALYASGVVASLYFIIRDKPLPATLTFAFALCLKLQSIFFLPVLIGYLAAKEFKVSYLLLLPILFALSILPAYLAGGSFVSWASQYYDQTNQYTYLTLNAPSVFAFISSLNIPQATQSLLSTIGILLAGISALFVLGTVFLSERRSAKTEEDRRERAWRYMRLGLISVIIVPFFLPHMHERYFYLADVIATLIALYQPKRWYLPVLVVGASFISYIPYLSSPAAFLTVFKAPLWIAAAAMLVTLLLLTIPRFISKRLSVGTAQTIA